MHYIYRLSLNVIIRFVQLASVVELECLISASRFCEKQAQCINTVKPNNLALLQFSNKHESNSNKCINLWN